jgi:transcriptional regulator with XRE-family HTH domain
MHDEDTVRVVRRWYAAWTRMPKPSEVAKALGVSKSALEQMARGETYKWVRR